MKNLTEQIAYIKGLAHGLELDEKNEYNNLLLLIINLLENMAYTLEDISYREGIIIDVLEELDNDLLLVENHLFDKNDDLFSGFDELNFDSYEQDHKCNIQTDQIKAEEDEGTDES